jgi:hypothetical protein
VTSLFFGLVVGCVAALALIGVGLLVDGKTTAAGAGGAVLIAAALFMVYALTVGGIGRQILGI